jgi:hypothetical protein
VPALIGAAGQLTYAFLLGTPLSPILVRIHADAEPFQNPGDDQEGEDAKQSDWNRKHQDRISSPRKVRQEIPDIQQGSARNGQRVQKKQRPANQRKFAR